MERVVTSIIIVAASGDAVAADEWVSNEALEDLATALGNTWKSVEVRRELPAIWMWEPLVDAGVISLAGIVAFAEVRLDDRPGERITMRELLRAWLQTVRFGLRVQIVWADYRITYLTETLDPGVSEELEPYGCQEQVA